MLFDVVKLAWVDKNFAGYPFEQPAKKRNYMNDSEVISSHLTDNG